VAHKASYAKVLAFLIEGRSPAQEAEKGASFNFKENMD